MRQMLVAALCGLLLFIIGVLVLNWQLWRAAYSDRVQEANLAVLLTDAMVDEARTAANTVRPLTAGTCTPEAQRLLNREAALGPHIGYVFLFKNHEVWCSSLLGSQTIKIQKDPPAGASLVLYSGDQIEEGAPVLFYLSHGISGYIGVSIGFEHLNTALKTASDKIRLTLIVGNKMLPYNGVVSPLTHSNTYRRSGHNPFMVEFDPPPVFSLQRLFSQGNLLLAMLAMMSLLTTWMLWRYFNKFISPEENLRRGIKNGEIVPFYQPVINSATGKINGFEVLARWDQPDAGFISPDVFIPVAEKSGLIVEMTHKLMVQVINDLTSILSELPEGLHVGINISAAHENNHILENDCLYLLDALSARKVSLVLEVTERQPLALTAASRAMFARLRSHGVLVALDDFGTGYSGISYLKEFPIDLIKIDKSFIRQISSTPDSTLLVDCVIEMAKTLSLEVIAEGVETQHQVEHLAAKGIRFLQGYYYCHPLPFSRLRELLRAV